MIENGMRQRKLEKQRQQMEEEKQRRMEQIVKETTVKVEERFTTQQEDYAAALAKDTVGLVTLAEFEQRKKQLHDKRAAELAALQMEKQAKDVSKKKGPEKAKKNKLSFEIEEEEEQEAEPQPEAEGKGKEGEGEGGREGSPGEGGAERPLKRIRMGKDPTINTSFLPDRKREEEEKAERERLAAEWRRKQEEIKKEEIEITYSYWDGTGHRSTVKCCKGDSVAHFLEKARQQFQELRGVSVDNLVYIKEDLIIPHHYTFYDFIINKVRGKSGPLFHFDVHDDVRLIADARVERDESHAGKVVERRWYERNKHIFPASRWEVYDPEKTFTTYTISDKTKK